MAGQVLLANKQASCPSIQRLIRLRLNAEERLATANIREKAPVTEPRDRKHPLKVVVSAKERETIRENAKIARLSVSAFLRNLGIGHQPKSSFDREAIRKMVKIHADQGRLGGLLKLWLSEKPGQGVSVKEVRSLLQQIESLQGQLANLVMAEKKRL